MSNNVPQIFKFEDNEVRTVIIGGDFWFVAADVCKILELANVSDAVSNLDNDEKNTIVLSDGTPGNPNRLCINEPGLYALVGRSRKSQAKAFDRWVRWEVLPAIRKTGSYSMDGKSPKEQLQNELTMLQFVQNAVDRISQSIAQPWIVEDKERVFYGKSAMDHLRLEVGRANKGYTEVAKYFHGKRVFDGFDARGRLAKFQMDIHNGRVVETQMRMPFSNDQ